MSTPPPARRPVPVPPGTLDLHNPNRRPIAPDDAARATLLTAEHVGDGRFVVTDAHGDAQCVTLLPFFECDCRTFLYPGTRVPQAEIAWYLEQQLTVPPVVCEHLVAALLRIDDPAARAAADAVAQSR